MKNLIYLVMFSSLIYCRNNIKEDIVYDDSLNYPPLIGLCYRNSFQNIKLVDTENNWDKSVEIDSLQVYPYDDDWKFSENSDPIFPYSLPSKKLASLFYAEKDVKEATGLRVMFNNGPSNSNDFILRRNSETYDTIKTGYILNSKTNCYMIDELIYNGKKYQLTDKIRNDILNIIVE